MSIRDEEIKRLTQYAKSLGLTVTWKSYKRGDPGAMWVQVDGKPVGIEMYTWPGQTKTQLILNLLHELAHHLEFVYRGRQDPKELLDALYLEYAGVKLNKRQRKLIYETETAACPYREVIANELGIKIPLYKLKADIDLDDWFYKQFYLTGKHPTANEINLQKRFFRQYYKELHGTKLTS